MTRLIRRRIKKMIDASYMAALVVLIVSSFVVKEFILGMWIIISLLWCLNYHLIKKRLRTAIGLLEQAMKLLDKIIKIKK